MLQRVNTGSTNGLLILLLVIPLHEPLAGDNSTGTRTGSATMVDIGGGRGELLLEVQAMYNLPTMKWLKLSMRPWVSIIEYVCCSASSG
jgi:hypothetical protein